MKILLQSTVFSPAVGGIETVSECLARHYVHLGHECTVVTKTPANLGAADAFPFPVVRNPSKSEKASLTASHDIIHSNGASLDFVPQALRSRKPLVWTHQGYQLLCIDGLGWYEGEPAPLAPIPSFFFHAKRRGPVKAAAAFAKLLIRRTAARFLHHVAITEWVARRQPLPGQCVIYNPFPLHRFAELKNASELPQDTPYDFFFAGRLVSEKGVATLLRAFALFLNENPAYEKQLLIIGDGNWRAVLTALAYELHIGARVHFAGLQTGKNLLSWVRQGEIAIIPSEWEEPMGGVALEMLSAGKPVIASDRGGLAECVGDAGLTFPNGDHVALAQQMANLLASPHLRQDLRRKAGDHLKKFDDGMLSEKYLDLFGHLLRR